jgi:hypothetical protein
VSEPDDALRRESDRALVAAAVAALQARADAAEAHAAELRAALVDIEWGLPNYRCPECKNIRENAHATRCVLGRLVTAALSAWRGGEK